MNLSDPSPLGGPMAPPQTKIPGSSGDSGWNLPVLFGCCFAGALLLGSWFFEPTRAWWDRLDSVVFYGLNGCLGGAAWVRDFFAFCTWRLFDLVPGLVILYFFVAYVAADGRRQFVRRSSASVAFVCFVLVVRKVIGIDLLDLARKSPSLVFDDAIRLSKQVEWIKCKDASGHSFPGDHSLFFMLVTVYFWSMTGHVRGLILSACLVLFSIPRLVTGAHWLTDNVVGGGAVTLLAMSLLLATPLLGILTRLFEPAVRKVLGRLERPSPAPDSLPEGT